MAHNITILHGVQQGEKIVSYGGKSVYSRDMRHWFMGVVHGCNADEMNNGGRLKYNRTQIPKIRKG